MKNDIDTRKVAGTDRVDQEKWALTDPIARKLHALTDQQLAAIVDSSDDAILIKDLRGVIHSWNRGAERLFGYKAEEVIGKPVTVLIPPDREKEEPYILQLIGGGERLDHYRTVRVRKNGTLVDISLSVTPIRDADGRVIGATKVARDVSDTRRADRHQDLFAQVQQQLAAIVESSGDAIFGVNLDGTIQTWNRGAERLFGYPGAEMVGKPAAMLIAAGRLDGALDLLRRVAAGEPAEPIGTIRRRADGTTADVTLNLSPIRDLSGAVVSVLVIARDVDAGMRPSAPDARQTIT
ncbi:MAG: PAS domain S-box protein [Rhodospirillaceae bacterium]|nr:PAS domain S-box protein [Rhodospirillaceae bacterium]